MLLQQVLGPEEEDWLLFLCLTLVPNSLPFATSVILPLGGAEDRRKKAKGI
jgi:hypothetical protein